MFQAKTPSPSQSEAILRWRSASSALRAGVRQLLRRYRLTLCEVGDNATIAGSFWGDDEAGLIGSSLYVRGDTPIHSLLHESCHFICMDAGRRHALHTNAGGTALEECAVCFLQILLAEQLGLSRQTIFNDMDKWGYSFRLGDTASWFYRDADDALNWLREQNLVTAGDPPLATGKLRGEP